MVGAEDLVWISNELPAVIYNDKVIIVGPQGELVTLEMGNPPTLGIKCLTEIDGLRILNS